MEYGCRKAGLEKTRGGVALRRTRDGFASAAQLGTSTYFGRTLCFAACCCRKEEGRTNSKNFYVHAIIQSMYDWSVASNRMNEALIYPSAQERSPAARHASSSEQR